jgi:hypothetical protein
MGEMDGAGLRECICQYLIKPVEVYEYIKSLSWETVV